MTETRDILALFDIKELGSFLAAATAVFPELTLKEATAMFERLNRPPTPSFEPATLSSDELETHRRVFKENDTTYGFDNNPDVQRILPVEKCRKRYWRILAAGYHTADRGEMPDLAGWDC